MAGKMTRNDNLYTNSTDIVRKTNFK